MQGGNLRLEKGTMFNLVLTQSASASTSENSKLNFSSWRLIASGDAAIASPLCYFNRAVLTAVLVAVHHGALK